MKVAEAKALVVELIAADLATTDAPVLLDPRSPYPRDPGKFVLGGKVARAIHHYDGWYVPIELIGERVGALGPGGESAAHRRLKLYVAEHPLEFGLSNRAPSHVEHRFRTGDSSTRRSVAWRE